MFEPQRTQPKIFSSRAPLPNVAYSPPAERARRRPPRPPPKPRLRRPPRPPRNPPCNGAAPRRTPSPPATRAGEPALRRRLAARPPPPRRRREGNPPPTGRAAPPGSAAAAGSRGCNRLGRRRRDARLPPPRPPPPGAAAATGSAAAAGTRRERVRPATQLPAPRRRLDPPARRSNIPDGDTIDFAATVRCPLVCATMFSQWFCPRSAILSNPTQTCISCKHGHP